MKSLTILSLFLFNYSFGQLYGKIDTLNKLYVINNTLEKYEALSKSRLESKEFPNYDYYIYDRISNYSEDNKFVDYSKILENYLSKNKVELDAKFEDVFQNYLKKYAVIKLPTSITYKNCRPDFFVIPNQKNDTIFLEYYIDKNCIEYNIEKYPNKEVILAINKEKYPNYKNFKFIHNDKVTELDFNKNISIKGIYFIQNSYSCRSMRNLRFSISKGKINLNINSNHFKNPNLNEAIPDYYWHILMNKLDFDSFKLIKGKVVDNQHPYIYENSSITIKDLNLYEYSISNPNIEDFEKKNKEFYEFVIKLMYDYQ